jgi:hypothetical protein
MRILKKAFAVLANIVLGITTLVFIVFVGFQSGLFGVFLYVFITLVWCQSVFDREEKPTLWTDLLHSSMALAWTFLNGLLYGSMTVCYFNYVAVLCVLCAVRMEESEA